VKNGWTRDGIGFFAFGAQQFGLDPVYHRSHGTKFRQRGISLYLAIISPACLSRLGTISNAESSLRLICGLCHQRDDIILVADLQSVCTQHAVHVQLARLRTRRWATVHPVLSQFECSGLGESVGAMRMTSLRT
jgi:hypothetical protein